MLLTRRKIEIVGGLIGVIIAGAVVWLWRIEPERRNESLGVNVVTQPSAEFEFDRPQVVYQKIRAGRSASGSFGLRNQTAKRQKVHFRSTPTAPEVGKTLRVKITAGTKTVFDGDAEGLEEWTSDPVPVESGEVETFDVQYSVEREPDGSLQGLGQDVTLSLEVQRSG